MPTTIFSWVSPRSACLSFFMLFRKIDVHCSPTAIPPMLFSERRIGDSPLAVFYHSTYPPALQHAGPLLWTFHIGLWGHGEASIMLEAERATRGICLFAMNMDDEWQEFTLFWVPAATSVRIEHAPDLTRTSPERRTIELVFPAVPPTQGPIPVQQLL
ncbi:hypothetical protein B0H12DRAFT_30804 [Mycena haematopus]|nr:hypothetical protein B0H12DRAFT_30804 [Mycena haematopus]